VDGPDRTEITSRRANSQDGEDLRVISKHAFSDPLWTIDAIANLIISDRVLAVGGIREKVMAARRNNIQTLLLPAANRADFEALPANVKAGFKVYFVENRQQAAAVGFDQSPMADRQAA
jgi:hypothetical protein